VLWESDRWFIVLNRNQDLLGKTMIVLKRHLERVVELTTEWEELLVQVREVTKRVDQAFAPDHFNYSFLMNVDQHVHLHVIPRYVEAREVAGARWDDPDFPHSLSEPVAERRLGAAEAEEVRRALGLSG
jgi:diadenosine tetraphosphate (Ap4A) HIT family hydrolase